MIHDITLKNGTGGVGQSVYTAKNGVVVTSSVANIYGSNNYSMGYLFDGIDNISDPSKYWLSAGGTTVTIDFDFNSILSKVNSFQKMILYPRTREDTISDYSILGSNDQSSWEELVPRVSNTYDNCPYGTAREHVLNRKLRYIRIELYRKGEWGATMNGIKFIADVVDDYSDTPLGSAYPVSDNGWKRIDDTHPAIKYKVNQPYGGMHFNADEISFSFVGDSLRLVYNYNAGNNGDVVYIDGTAYPTTKTSRGTSTLVFTKSGLGFGEHKVLIKTYVGGDWFSQFDAVEIGKNGFMPATMGTQYLSPEDGWRRFDDDRLSYPNGHTLSTGISNMYGGQARVLDVAKNQNLIKFKFYGSMLRMYAGTYTGRNNYMRIRIDDKPEEFFTSDYPTSNVGQVIVYEKLGMEKTLHDVTIDFGLPLKNGGQFFMDAVDIDDDGYIVGALGASLPQPDNGWRRFGSKHSSISYLNFSNGWAADPKCYGGYISYDDLNKNANAKISFKFTGTKLRIISAYNTATYRGNNIIKVDGVTYTYTEIGVALQYTALQFELTGLEDKEHTVEITKTANMGLSLEAIDIDGAGRLLHPREVLTESGMKVGDRIRCHYAADAPITIGTFSRLGEETGDFLPFTPVSTVARPEGDFYLIAVEEDSLGRMKLLADRNIHAGIPWTTLNDEGFVTGRVLGKELIPTIPPMTSNVGNGVSLSTNTPNSGNYEPWKAFNGDYTVTDVNRWIAPNPSPAWLKISYDAPRTIKAYSLLARIYNLAAPKSWQMHGSNNGTDWTLLDSRTNETGLLNMRKFYMANDTPYLSYRLTITANNGYPSYFVGVDNMQLFEEEDSGIFALASLPTGGVSATDKDNDWDKFVVNSDFNGTSNAGDNKVWNWSGFWSYTINTYATTVINRTVRGNSVNGHSYVGAGDNIFVNSGFRPMFLMSANQKGSSTLLCEIYVRPRVDIATTLHVYKDSIIGGEFTHDLVDVTVPVTATDWKGYAVEVSGVYDSSHQPWLAFNNSLSDYYVYATPAGATTGWFIFDYGQPLRIAGYGVGARTNYPAQTPRDWKFYGSNDKQTWTLLDNVGNSATWSAMELRKYVLKGEAYAKTFRYYKMEFSNSATGNQLSIGEIELYEAYQVAVEQRKSYVDVPYRNDFASTITVKPHGRMKGRFAVAPVYLSDTPSSIQVKIHDNLVSYISVRTKGKMRGTFSVTPPPKIEVNLSPIKDAFVRSNVPRLNYGEEQEMLVGRMGDGEDYNSLIQFDVSSIPAGQKLKSAKLKLYVEQTGMVGTPIGLYEVKADWEEVGVTWASTPAYGRKLAELSADVAKEYAEVDVLSTVQEWYDGTAVNKGILLKAEQQLLDVFARFGTRERGAKYAPKLVVEYYDPNVASTGYSDMIAHIVAQQNKYKDLTTKITVNSTWDSKDIQSNIHVLNPMMLETFLTVQRENMHSYITVKRKDEYNMASTITVQVRKDSVMNSKISVSRDFVTGGITVRRIGTGDLPSVITVRREDVADVASSIGVSRPDLVGSITIVSSSMLPSSITVTGGSTEDLESILTVRRSDSKDITASADVWAKSLLESSITIKSGYLASSITVPFKGYKDLKTTIRVSERFASDLTTTLEVVQGSSLPCSITVEIYEDGTYAFIM